MKTVAVPARRLAHVLAAGEWFDGSAVEGVPVRRTPGVRVVFSPAGRAADPVIIEHLRALPARVPVVVASSDGWVRDAARADGATVIPADALLAVLRR